MPNAAETELRPKLTQEFMDVFLQAARTYGWSGDYVETAEFTLYLFRLADMEVPRPFPEPYENTEDT